MPWITVSQVVAVDQPIVVSGVNMLGQSGVLQNAVMAVGNSLVKCASPGCSACRAMAKEDGFEPQSLSCPVIGCSQHGEMYSRLPMSGLMPLRQHIRKHHAARELVQFTNPVLFLYYRLTACAKTGCGKVVMSKSSQAIPAVDAHLEATYERIPAMRGHGCGMAVAGQVRAGNAVGNNVQGGGVARGPNPTMYPWLAEALMVVNDIKDLSALPAVPPMVVARLPGGSHVVTEGISQIYTTIDQALKIVGLSGEDECNLMKLAAIIPRFLFLAPCRDELGREVAITKGVAARVKKFCTVLDGPRSLWVDHGNVARIAAVNKAFNVQKARLGVDGSIIISEEEAADKRNTSAARAIKAKEVGKAYDFLTSDFTQVQLDKEGAVARMEGKFDYSDTVSGGPG